MDSLRQITKKRLSEEAMEQIRDLIVRKRMKEGAQLPSERELVERLGVSRASIREALRTLEIVGIVEILPGKGAYVKDPQGDLLVPLPAWLSTHKETLHHHFEARLVLEPPAAALAASRANKTQIKAMQKILKSFRQKLDRDDLVGIIRKDIEFHRMIAEATDNKTIKLLMDTIARYTFDGWKASLRISDRIAQTVLEHQKIVECIAAGDEQGARDTMVEHLQHAVENISEAGLE